MMSWYERSRHGQAHQSSLNTEAGGWKSLIRKYTGLLHGQYTGLSELEAKLVLYSARQQQVLPPWWSALRLDSSEVQIAVNKKLLPKTVVPHHHLRSILQWSWKEQAHIYQLHLSAHSHLGAEKLHVQGGLQFEQKAHQKISRQDEGCKRKFTFLSI